MPAIITPPVRYTATELRTLCSGLEARGYDGVWAGEVNNVDSVTTTAVAAASTERAEVAAVLNVFTRAPSTLAITAAALGDLAPGRAAVVLGVASPLLVERYNGIPYARPLARLRDTVHFLRKAMEGGRVTGDFETFSTGGFGLTEPPAIPPKIYIASSGRRSMEFASTHADSVVINWTGPDELDLLPELPSERSKIILQVMVCPTPDRQVFDQTMRGLVADYLCAPAYAGLQRRLGRGAVLEPMWDAFARKDRTAVHQALPASCSTSLWSRAIQSNAAGAWSRSNAPPAAVSPSRYFHLPAPGSATRLSASEQARAVSRAKRPTDWRAAAPPDTPRPHYATKQFSYQTAARREST